MEAQTQEGHERRNKECRELRSEGEQGTGLERIGNDRIVMSTSLMDGVADLCLDCNRLSGILLGDDALSGSTYST